AIDAWVTGLTFVRQRLLDLLAAADVQPIDALGQPFDPQQHVAIGVVPPSQESPAGTVVEELRRGYRAGERVLRHAEVLVAASEEQRL
ncbi:MAG: nucleotide exchange factor GrpE, partial [Roseiflexaceae bacterium]